MKIKNRQRMKAPKVIEVDQAPASVQSFVEAMDQIDLVLVNRTEEIEAAKLCLVTRSHLMLEGPHGTAKSMLADEIFRRITGAVVFKKQFMKGTQTDEVLGPMNSQLYRDKAIWEHNTVGMLPGCHFFYGDEIYRASDQCLPVMMGILNEREFINAGKPVRCPLITAIGTTNFTTDSEELEAFHDRWHVKVKTEHLTAPSDVRRMFSIALDKETIKPLTVDLEDIYAMNRAVREIPISEDILDLLPEVFSKYSKAISGAYISDRRKVQALGFMQAAALLNGDREVTPEHIEGCRFIMTRLREQTHSSAWANVVSATIGEFQKSKAEGKSLRKLEKVIAALEGEFDPSMKQLDMKTIWEQAKKFLAAINNMTPDEQPTSHAGVSRMDTCRRKLEELCSSIAEHHVF